MTAQRPSRPFGGELPASPAAFTACLTDSGRSSLRLALRSGCIRGRVLLPDFLCGVVAALLAEFGIETGYYHVTGDLQIDPASVRGQSFDVLYVIDYFGSPSGDYSSLLHADQWLVQDCVFLPVVKPPERSCNWLGFNSLRKISALADGSMVVAATPLDRQLICREDAPFAAVKYRAKALKQAFLNTAAGIETDYLSLFEQGERMIDLQHEIYPMSAASLARYADFLATLPHEIARRNDNLEILRGAAGGHEIRRGEGFPSYFLLRVSRRDEIRTALRQLGIYLPSHWPHSHGPDNPLYRTLLPVPLDAAYSAAEMERVAAALSAVLD